MQPRLWRIKEYPFHPEKLGYYETIFAIGNGYLGSRATFEERHPHDHPVTLIHGIFNQSPTGQVPELVNVPNWTEIGISVDGTPFTLVTKTTHPLNPPDGLLIGYERELLMDVGCLRRTVLFRAASGATVRITFERFASLANQHLMVQRVQIVAIDGDPTVTVTSCLNGDVSNDGNLHWGSMQAGASDGVLTLDGVTNESGYRVSMASQLVTNAEVTTQAAGIQPSATLTIPLGKDGETELIKYTTIYTSRDTDHPLQAAIDALHSASQTAYSDHFAAHSHAWEQAWSTADIRIKGDEQAQIGTRFATYHILIAAPRHDDDVSIGAKTLSGLGYKGHVFWDTELFMLPPFTLTHPEVARNMLMYRYKRLAGARQKAAELNYEGAMFPWESTDTGIETTPKWSDDRDKHGNRIRIWTGDNEQHISTDITYAILQYWRWTGDNDFLLNYGAEMVLDTAVFWGSRVEEMNGRYELHNQIGPDEYHENVSNSVFTNRMVQWHLQQALDLLTWLRQSAPDTAAQLAERLNLSNIRLAKWQDIINRMVIPFDADKQIHIQFEGFFDMEYIPVPKFEPRVGGIWGYLGHERALQSQVIKQADVVMMMALLGDAVGSEAVMHNNWETYYQRCDHGSSLSPAIHAWVAARLGRIEEAYHMFEHAAAIDLGDNKGNVDHGIHGAACGGLWQAVVFGFCGLHLTDEGPAIAPKLPAHWEAVEFSVVYRGKKHTFSVTP